MVGLLGWVHGRIFFSHQFQNSTYLGNFRNYFSNTDHTYEAYGGNQWGEPANFMGSTVFFPPPHNRCYLG